MNFENQKRLAHLSDTPISALVVACFDSGLHHQTAVGLVEAIINRDPKCLHASVTEGITEIYDVECGLNYGGPLADFCRDVRYVLIEIQKGLVA